MYRKCALALSCLAAGVALAGAADAAVFNFSFVAPWQNPVFGDDDEGLTFIDTSDIGRGSGTFTTEEADADGAYRILSAAGGWTFYDGESPRAINAFSGGFGGDDAGLITFANGIYSLTNIGLYDDENFGGIAFAQVGDVGGNYIAFGGEVISTAPTFTIEAAEVADVPEPASWAMMVAGFGLVGGAIRRRKVAVTFA